MKNTTTIIVIFLFIVLSCKKVNPDAPTDPNIPPVPVVPTVDKDANILQENCHIVDTSAFLTITDDKLSILKTKTQYIPKIDDIIISLPTQQNPYGVLRKVKSIDVSSTEFKCDTEESNLNDAFKQLKFDFFYTDDSQDSFRAGPNISLAFTKPNSLLNEMELSGNVNLKIPQTHFIYEKDAGSISPKKIVIQSVFLIEGDLELSKSTTSSLSIEEKILKTFTFKSMIILIPIATPVGIIPIPLKFAHRVNIKILPLNVKGKLAIRIHPIINALLYVKFENGTWKNLSSLSNEAIGLNGFCKENFIAYGEATANLTILKPEYEILPYGLKALSAYFAIPNTLTAKASTTKPNYSLKYGLGLEGGIKTKFWNGTEGNFSITANIVDKTLHEGNIDLLKTPEITTTDSLTWYRYVNYNFNVFYLTWKAVPGAKSYVIEEQYKDDFDNLYHPRAIYQTVSNLTLPISGVGAQWCRFRMMAHGENECIYSDSTNWRYILYLN